MGQPGDQWHYSVAPDVLSLLIEQYSGVSTRDFLVERIFKPLKMKDTGYNLTKEQQSRVVILTSKNKEEILVNSPYVCNVQDSVIIIKLLQN